MNICRHIGHTVPAGHDLSRRNPERMATSYNRKIDRIRGVACCYRGNPDLLYPNRLDQRLANNCLGAGAIVTTSLNCPFLNDIHPVFPRSSFVLQNLRRSAAMVAVQDWYFHHALLVESYNGWLSNCWLEGIAVGFASNGGSIEWRECYSTVKEGVFEGIFDSRFASAALCGWAVAGDELLLWAIHCCYEVLSSICSVGRSKLGENGECAYLLEDERKGEMMSADQPTILLRTMVRSLLITFHSDTAGACTSPAATNKISTNAPCIFYLPPATLILRP